MEMPIVEQAQDGYIPLNVTPVGNSWEGAKSTNTEARRLVAELLSWSNQFNHSEGIKLQSALRDVEKLFIRVWTEIDESLLRLILAAESPKNYDVYRAQSLMMLHRWQDRGGAIGNATFRHGEFAHGATRSRRSES